MKGVLCVVCVHDRCTVAVTTSYSIRWTRRWSWRRSYHASNAPHSCDSSTTDSKQVHVCAIPLVRRTSSDSWYIVSTLILLKPISIRTIFSALQGIPARTSDEKGVCLSVKGIDCDKMEESYVRIFISYERSFSLVFWEEEWLVGAIPSTWNLGSNWTLLSKIADFLSIFARSPSAVTPSEKSSIDTNRKSTTRFPMSPR